MIPGSSIKPSIKALLPVVLAMTIASPTRAQTDATSRVVSAVPALNAYTSDVVENNLWQRSELSPRDRSILTVSAAVARHHTGELSTEFQRALDNGVTPSELSEIVTHLAFYAGWGTAKAASPILAEVFTANHVDFSTLPDADVTLSEQDAEGEAARLQSVEHLLGDANPGLAQFTTDPLFSEIWLRPDLSPRDRSLVTITSLIALGQTAQLRGHLNRALDNGLTGEEAGEVVAHLAFYSGWPTAFSAGPIVLKVLRERAE